MPWAANIIASELTGTNEPSFIMAPSLSRSGQAADADRLGRGEERVNYASPTNEVNASFRKDPTFAATQEVLFTRVAWSVVYM